MKLKLIFIFALLFLPLALAGVDGRIGINLTPRFQTTFSNYTFNETDPLAYNGTLAYNSSLSNYYLNSNPNNYISNSTCFSSMFQDYNFYGIDSTGLMLYLPGNNNTLDYSGNSRDFISVNSSFVSGKLGKSFNFYDNTSFLYAPRINLSLSVFTFSAWVNYQLKPNFEDHHQIFSPNFNYGSNLGYIWQIENLNGSVGHQKIWGGSSSVTSTVYVPNNTWTFLTVVHNGTHVLFYQNGVFSSSSSLSLKNDSITNWAIVGHESSTVSSRDFLGSIDELMMFNRSLSPDEVRALYENTKGSVGNTNFGSNNVTALNFYGNFIGNGSNLYSVNETDPKAYNGTLAYNSSLSNYYLNSNPNNFLNTTMLDTMNLSLDNVSVRSRFYINGRNDGPAQLTLNHTHGRVGQVLFTENNTNKWSIRDNAKSTSGNLEILRYNNETGAYIDSPFIINDTGEIYLNGDTYVQSGKTLNAVTSTINTLYSDNIYISDADGGITVYYSSANFMEGLSIGYGGLSASGEVSAPSGNFGEISAGKSYITTSDPEMEVFSVTNWTNILILDSAVPMEKKGLTIFFDGKNEVHWNSLTGDYFIISLQSSWFSEVKDFLGGESDLGKIIETGNVPSLGSLNEGYHLDYKTRTYYKEEGQKKNKIRINVTLEEAVESKSKDI